MQNQTTHIVVGRWRVGPVWPDVERSLARLLGLVSSLSMHVDIDERLLRLNSAAGGRTRQRLDVAGARGDVAGAGGRGRAGGDATCAEARERTRTRTAGDMLLRSVL